MPDKPISKDQEMQDAEYQSDVEAEEISSSAETSDPPSPSPKTPSNARGTKKTISPRGAKIFSNIKVNQVSRQEAYRNIPSKRPIGFEFQAGPGGRKKATTAFKAARDHDESRQAEEKVLEARQCLISAANLLGSRPNEQSRILELIEVMRNFTEKKELPTAASIISTQTNALEKTIRKFDETIAAFTATHTNALENTICKWNDAIISHSNSLESQRISQVERQINLESNPVTSLSSSPQMSGQSQSPSFAEIARRNLPQPKKTLETTTDGWSSIGKNGKVNTIKQKPVRLVLEAEDKNKPIKPLLLRDTINKTAKDLGFERLFALSTTRSARGNLVVQLANREARDFAYQSIEALRKAIGFRKVLEDDSCYKVVIHGVSTEDFDVDNGLTLIREEIETYNSGLRPTGDPIWLTNQAKRRENQGASILVTFQTEEEAKRAIRHRLFIGGASLRAELAKDKSKVAHQGGQC
jgi:hypothetical protein